MKVFFSLLILLLQLQPILAENISNEKSNRVRNNWIFQNINLSDTLIKIKQDSIVPIKPVSLIKSQSKNFDKFLLERSNYLSVIHLLNLENNSFLFDLGLPSNFYELSLQQSNNRSNTYLINDIQINDPLTNIFDLRDLRYDEFESITIIFPTRSFLLSRNNTDNTIVFNEWSRYSATPLSRIRYIEAPYDNLFFDGLFNVNLSRKYNFEFGVTKHNAQGRFQNSEKDLWAGKIKVTHFFSNKFNLALTYRYSKSIVQFNEGINIYNPLVPQNEPIDNILYDNQRAIAINDDAYHKWTYNLLNLNFKTELNSNYQAQINFYLLHSLREFRDNEHKADSIRAFEDHLSKLFGASIKQNFDFFFNKFELKFNFDRVSIKSPHFFNSLSENLISIYGIHQIELTEKFIPSFYAKLNKNSTDKRYFVSFGTDLNFNISNKMRINFGISKFQKIISYDERYFYEFNLTDYVSNILLASGMISLFDSKYKLNSEFYYRKEINPSSVLNFYSIEQGNSVLNNLFPEVVAYGLKTDFSISLWKLNSRFGISFNENRVSINNISYRKPIYPKYQIQFEIFYRDLLFKSSLDLMAGIRCNLFSSFYGKSFAPSKLLFIDIRTYNDSLLNFGLIQIPSNFNFDLVISGKVKKEAIIYLSIENLFNRKYFLIPYYPTNDIQFRFGISWEFYD